jgi:hypothetical protein
MPQQTRPRFLFTPAKFPSFTPAAAIIRGGFPGFFQAPNFSVGVRGATHVAGEERMTGGLIQARWVYHRSYGAFEMNGVDAASAVSNNPLEWSFEKWSPEVLAKAEARVRFIEEQNRVPPVGALEVRE